MLRCRNLSKILPRFEEVPSQRWLRNRTTYWSCSTDVFSPLVTLIFIKQKGPSKEPRHCKSATDTVHFSIKTNTRDKTAVVVAHAKVTLNNRILLEERRRITWRGYVYYGARVGVLFRRTWLASQAVFSIYLFYGMYCDLLFKVKVEISKMLYNNDIWYFNSCSLET